MGKGATYNGNQINVMLNSKDEDNLAFDITILSTPENVYMDGFNVTYDSKTYLAGMYGGAGVNAIRLPYIYYNEAPEDSAQQMLASIDAIYNEPVVVHIGNHPYNNHTLEKREKQLLEGGNPFIAPDSWHEFLDELKGKVQKVIKDNEELEKMLSLL